MAHRKRRRYDPDQYDLFQPAHECCEDARGPYLQFLIAPPSELAGPGPPGPQNEAPGNLRSPGALIAS